MKDRIYMKVTSCNVVRGGYSMRKLFLKYRTTPIMLLFYYADFLVLTKEANYFPPSFLNRSSVLAHEKNS